MSAAPRDNLTPEELARFQADRLTALLREVLPSNGFYARKFAAANLDPTAVRCYADLRHLPFTTKAELLADQAEHPPYGDGLTYPLERYRRLLPDLRHIGPAAALAGHAGKLVVDAR